MTRPIPSTANCLVAMKIPSGIRQFTAQNRENQVGALSRDKQSNHQMNCFDWQAKDTQTHMKSLVLSTFPLNDVSNAGQGTISESEGWPKVVVLMSVAPRQSTRKPPACGDCGMLSLIRTPVRHWKKTFKILLPYSHGSV
jgi:hypothetical protein